MTYRKLLIATSLLASLSGWGAVKWQTHSSDFTIALSNATDTSDANPNRSDSDGFNLCCNDGVSVKLTKKEEGVSLYRLFSAIIATNGVAPTVTIDVTGLEGAPLRLHNHFHFKSDATLVIKGTNVVEFGANESWPTYFPTFNVRNKVRFTDAEGTEIPGKIRFVDKVSMFPLPSDLAYEIGDNAMVAPRNNALGISGDLTLSNYDLVLCDMYDSLSSMSAITPAPTGSIPSGTKITVPTGRILYIFPTRINANFRWDRPRGWMTNDVVLAGGRLGIGSAGGNCDLTGSLTGTGDIFGAWVGSRWGESTTTIWGPVCFTGAVNFAQQGVYYSNTGCSRDARLAFRGVQPGTRITGLTFGVSEKVSNGFAFYGDATKSASDYAANPVVIEQMANASTNYASFIKTEIPLTIQSDPGSIDVYGAGSLTLGAVAPTTVVRSSVPVQLPEGVYAYKVGDVSYVAGTPHNTGLVVEEPVTAKVVSVTTSASLVAGSPKWEARVPSGATLTLTPSTNRMSVAVEGGTVKITGAAEAWRDLATYWFDASDAASVSNLTVNPAYGNSYVNYDKAAEGAKPLADGTVYYTNGFPFVNMWFDRRPEYRTKKLWSDRYDNLWNGQHNIMHGTHPHRVLGGLNGLDYISFGSSSGDKASCTHPYRDGSLATLSVLKENSRAFIYNQTTTTPNGAGDNKIKPSYAILVFGSQNGGGYNILGGQTHALHRPSNALSAALTARADVISDSACKAWIDGREVAYDQANVLNGGWQIITLKLNKRIEFTTLGSPGGQNYAEMIFFEEAISDRMRQEIEIYLADKWGLTDNYAYPEWSKGKDELPHTATIYGSGTVQLGADAKLSGSFAGTIDLNGQALTVEGSLPPDDSTIDTTDCTGWFDPERTDLMTTGNLGLRSPQPRITRLFGRHGTEDGKFCLQERSRAPWKNVSARRFGPARNWMDFSNYGEKSGETASGNNNGNLFQFRPIKNGDGQYGMWTNYCRTIILAQDSVRGGGQPFVDGSSVLPSAASQKYKERIGHDASYPIYPSGLHGLLTQGKTYLDGLQVDGTKQGFQGRAEILSVIPTNRYGFLCFEHLSNSERKTKATCTSAIHGEILMWDRVLGDAERQNVESYLSWKWLGIPTEGHSMLTNATVTGAGTVKAESLDVLPKFAAECTATVSISTNALAFHYAGGSIVDGRNLGGATVALPAACTVSVDFTEKPVAGEYVLLSSGAGLDTPTFSLQTTGTTGSTSVKLVQTATSLKIRATASGTLMIFR